MRRLVFSILLLMIMATTGLGVDYMNQWRLQNYAAGSVTPETYMAALPARVEAVTGDISAISLGGGETIGSYIDDFKATIALNEEPETGGVLVNRGGSGFSNRDIATRIDAGEMRADGLLGANADDLGDISPQDMYRSVKKNLLRAGLSEAEADRKAREAAQGMEDMMQAESTGN